ncbi:hypothetical protein NYP18_05565 [Corynebacterium sp. YIM 101645]|uniref:DUF4190 domain-containing protein n=1 Tax=Corynebacterium lemuris TaxID=1859292 RepID=A0ABT2FV50_9CORY|nr:DUF4190 domain-containing protein [Corynebacterium lemuris]MCS5479117.1 hypothetical protein [Corynebacterium lemuris]
MTNPNDPQQPNFGAYQYPSGNPEQASGQPPAYGSTPGYGSGPVSGSTWAMAETPNRVAPWALGVGILALLMGVSIVLTAFAFIPGIIGLILGVIAIVRGRSLSGPARRTGMSVAGLVMSIIGILLSVVFWVLMSMLVTESGIGDCVTLTDPGAQQQCIEDALNEWSGGAN